MKHRVQRKYWRWCLADLSGPRRIRTRHRETIYRESAEAALKLLEAGTKVDLVFSDIVMPGTIDGVGLAREIRSRYPNLPVVLTTGYSDAASAAPANLRILRKPFDTEALREFMHDIAPPRLLRPSGVPPASG